MYIYIHIHWCYYWIHIHLYIYIIDDGIHVHGPFNHRRGRVAGLYLGALGTLVRSPIAPELAVNLEESLGEILEKWWMYG